MELRQVLEGADVAEIRAKTQELQDASVKLADAVYAQAAQAASSGPTPSGDGAAAHEDEVVEEAEYEVVDEEEAKR